MEPLEKLAAGIKHVDELLDEDALEPDAGRNDWSTMTVRARMARDGLDREVLGVLNEALASVEEEEVRAVVKGRVATLIAGIGAMLEASGDPAGAASMRGRAKDLASDKDQRAELDAGDAEPQLWARLHHARWLLFHGRRPDADRAAKEVSRRAKEPALRDGARAILRAPRAITSAPTLFRVNGCGVGLYGERDRNDEGWYIATYCISLLWIPVLPLTAYRVRQNGDNGYSFVAQEALSPIARAWQLIVAAAVVLALGFGGVKSYLDSPDRKARVALEAAQAAEKRGDRAAALEGYTRLVREDAAGGPVASAAESVIRLGAAAVPDPCTADAVDKVSRVVDSLQTMPPAGRAAAAPGLVKRLGTWADQIGDGSPAQINAALTVLDMAAKVADASATREVDEKRGKLRRALADKVVDVRPLQALSLYARPPATPESLAAAAKIVESFGPAPSLWIEAEHDVVAWASAAEKRPELAAAAKSARAQLKAAEDARAAYDPLRTEGDEKQLAKELAKSPGDQEVAMALALAQRRRGDVKAALATLVALGEPGRMTAGALQLFASCLAEAGDPAKAQAILEALLAERLPAFQQAQRDYDGAEERAQRQIVADAKRGIFDAELGPKMQHLSDAEQGKVFREWLSERIQADPQLKAMRAEFVRHASVVPTSLLLGQLQLRRANAASGEERRALLAAAEKTLLSIQAVAEGNPMYHLNLGQVYHRLGRTKEGNAELDGVLARKDPELTLGVAHIYRDLGLPVRAKQIAEGLWGSATEPRWKHDAATMMSHLVNDTGNNEDEEEMWLKRADTSSEYVKLLLLRLDARRLRRQGKMAEADRAFAKLIAAYERDAAHDGAAANNAAVAYEERYGASGDPAHMRSAVKHLEAAHRLQPQNALVAGNLADSLVMLGTVTVLDRWIKMRTLAPTSHEAHILLAAMVDGSMRAEVLEAMRKDPSFRRSLDVALEEQTLAPQKSDGYDKQLQWLRWNDDQAALAEMAKRVAAMPPFDTSKLEEIRRAHKEGTKDALKKAMLVQSIARVEETVKRAEQAGHAPTLAAARLVLSVERTYLADLDPTKENLDAMIEPARRAAQGWPEGGMDDELAPLLALAGLERAALASPAIAKLLAADRRRFGAKSLLFRAMSGPDGAASLEALRKQPELVEAARLRKAHASRRPTLLDVALARVAGDAEMEQAASAVFDRAAIGSDLAIQATMAPGQEVEQYELELWKSRGKPR